MLLRKYDNLGDYKFVLALQNREFISFLNRFKCSLISKGKKSIAFKMFNKILLNFKQRFGTSPIVELHKAINNILPLLSVSYRKKLGKNKGVHIFPALALGDRRFIIMLDWILRKQRGKDNVEGFNIDEVSVHLMDANINQGKLMRLKQQYYNTALSNQHMLQFKKKVNFDKEFTLKKLRAKLEKKPISLKKEIEEKKKNEKYYDEFFNKKG